MKKMPVIIKMMPVVLSLPFLLTGCESLKGYFGDDSSKNLNYGSSYSSHKSQTNNQYPPTDKVNNEEGNYSADGADNQSGAAVNTVNVPVGSDNKAVKGTVDAPAVPSTAPTVAPTAGPAAGSTVAPAAGPAVAPAAAPAVAPAAAPAVESTIAPAVEPAVAPTMGQ